MELVYAILVLLMTQKKTTTAISAYNTLLNRLFQYLSLQSQDSSSTLAVELQNHMIRKITKAMAVQAMGAAIPISLALAYSCPTGNQHLATSLGPYLAVGCHGGVLTTPRSEFGLRFPKCSGHRLSAHREINCVP